MAPSRNLPEWWRRPGALDRFVADLVLSELRALRPQQPVPGAWNRATPLGADGLGLDSLELLGVSSALSETLELHRTGIEDLLLARRTLGDWADIAQASLARFDGSVTFRSSGSTGAPKRAQHALADLDEEVAQIAALLPGRGRILAAVPCHHIYGFIFTLLLPARLDLDVHDLRASSPRAALALSLPGDLVVGHPEFWRALGEAAEGSSDVVGVTSTAPCPAEVARAVTPRPLARLIQVYGSTETAGIGWRDAEDGDYRLFRHWQRGASAGSVLRVRAGAAAAEHRLPDRVAWTGDASFRVQGRLDDIVQVGGENVATGHVSAVLCEHPDVAAAAVRLMTAGEGNRLKAFIVPRGDGADRDALRSALQSFIEARLPVPARPRALTFGTALPTSPIGKQADWMIGLGGSLVSGGGPASGLEASSPPT